MIGKKIRRLRKKNGFTQKQLADELQIHQNMISLWETERYEPTLFMACCLADIFGVSLDELCGRVKREQNN